MTNLAATVKSVARQHAFLFVLLLLSIAGFFFTQSQYKHVFPSASIDMSLSRDEILKIAAKWSKEVGFSTEGTLHAIDFEADNEAKVFLEREFSQKRANETYCRRPPGHSCTVHIPNSPRTRVVSS